MTLEEFEKYAKEHNLFICTTNILEQIKADIQKVLNAEDFASENAKAQALALMWVLELFDKYKYTKGERE